MPIGKGFIIQNGEVSHKINSRKIIMPTICEIERQLHNALLSKTWRHSKKEAYKSGFKAGVSFVKNYLVTQNESISC